jgi:uncharacterized membrane protein YccC
LTAASFGVASKAMRVLAGILGVVVGFLVGGVLIDLFFPDESWPDVIPFVLAVMGGVAGAATAGRLSR